MADFRRCILALALLVLVLGIVAPASAQSTQPFGCVANASVPPLMRYESLTELVGDLVLNCSGGTPTPVGTVIPTANITVFLPHAITSRITAAGTPAVTDALLLVDDPGPGQQNVCTFPTNPAPPNALPGDTNCLVNGDGGTSFKTNGAFNVFQGIVTGSPATSVTFLASRSMLRRLLAQSARTA